MKRALIKSVNLIGDGLWVGPVAKKWYDEVGRTFGEIKLFTIKNHAVEIYKGMGVPWEIVFEESGDHDYTFDFDVSRAFQISDKKRCHLMNSYAEMMGVDLSGVPVRPNYRPPKMEISDDLKNRVLISMWSLSCASQENPPRPPNKMLKWEHWPYLLEVIREEYPGSKIGVIGGPKDGAPKELGLAEDEHLLGLPIPETAHAMRYAKCVITPDNGMAHLATSQQANQFYMAAWCLALHYIVGWGNPNLRTFHLDPVNVNPVTLASALRSAIRDWKAQ